MYSTHAPYYNQIYVIKSTLYRLFLNSKYLPSFQKLGKTDYYSPTHVKRRSRSLLSFGGNINRETKKNK